VFVVLRVSLEPLINRLFDPDPEPPAPLPDLRLSLNASTTLEQLHRFYGLPLPLPLEVAGFAAAQSLGSLLAQAEPLHASGEGVRVGPLLIQAEAEPDPVSVLPAQGAGSQAAARGSLHRRAAG